MKILEQPIQVQTDASGKPVSFYWERKYPVGHKEQGVTVTITAIEDSWREVGEWWRGELQKDFYRVSSAEGSFVLWVDTKGEWVLYKVLD